VSSQPIEPQVCPRHQDRTTFLACTRCGRPACPQCLVPAAVGFHCVDCLATQPKPQGRTLIGARSTGGKPLITRLILAAAIAAFIAQQVVPGFTRQFWLVGLAFDSGGLVGVAIGEWWRLVTVGFLHGGFIHIAFNMYALWLLGPNLEQVYGHRRFAVIYSLALLGGSTASYFFNAPNTPAVGASGAIFGLFGATIVVARRLGRDASGIYAILLINVVIGFTVPNIDWRAHAGGLVVGAAVAWLVDGRRKRVAQLGGPILVLALLLVALAMRTNELRSALGLS
jgi:membrane associated rhomboid family serine protease